MNGLTHYLQKMELYYNRVEYIMNKECNRSFIFVEYLYINYFI